MFRISGSSWNSRLFSDKGPARHDVRGDAHDHHRTAVLYVRRLREGRQTARKDPVVGLQAEVSKTGRKALSDRKHVRCHSKTNL